MSTVRTQHLQGATDTTLVETCRAEGRCLVTLDLGFANPRNFRPREWAGLAVVRLPRHATTDLLVAALRRLDEALRVRDVRGRLWIVDIERVREFQDPGSDGPA